MSEDTTPWRVFFDEASLRFTNAGLESPETDARRIVEQAAGFEPGEWLLRLDEPATVRGVGAFDKMVARRLTGEPLQYVIGSWSFRTLDLMVDKRVLIPRPETETVVGLALEELKRWPKDPAPVVVDLGTGSGCIGLSMAVEHPTAQVICTDVSSDAVAVARANLAGIGRAAPRVRVVQGGWFDALEPRLSESVTLVISNPPYVATSDPLPEVVREWEPSGALFGGDSGLEPAELILSEASGWLCAGGALVMELGETQLEQARKMAEQAGFVDIEVHKDLARRDRCLLARKPR